MKEEYIFGGIFGMISVTLIALYVLAGYPALLFWFSNHWVFVLALGCLIGRKDFIHAELNIALIGETIWIIDFLGRLLFDKIITGSTSYLFRPNYPRLLYTAGLFHLIVLPIALIAWWR